MIFRFAIGCCLLLQLVYSQPLLADTAIGSQLEPTSKTLFQQPILMDLLNHRVSSTNDPSSVPIAPYTEQELNGHSFKLHTFAERLTPTESLRYGTSMVYPLGGQPYLAPTVDLNVVAPQSVQVADLTPLYDRPAAVVAVGMGAVLIFFVGYNLRTRRANFG